MTALLGSSASTASAMQTMVVVLSTVEAFAMRVTDGSCKAALELGLGISVDALTRRHKSHQGAPTISLAGAVQEQLPES